MGTIKKNKYKINPHTLAYEKVRVGFKERFKEVSFGVAFGVVVAVILTILGYSVNDTIVIYDKSGIIQDFMVISFLTRKSLN